MNPFKLSLRFILLLTISFVFSGVIYAETEPNNDVANANLINVNEKTTGSLSSSDEFDYFKIVITEDGRLSIMDTTSTNLDYHINLYDSDGTTLIRSELRYKDNSGGRIAINLSPDTYYLQLDRYVTTSGGTYSVYPLFEPVTYPGDSEVNDDVSSAIILTLNEENTGNLGSRRDGVYDDLDYWKITIEEDGRLSILDTTESQLDYYVYLYDADGTTLINSALRYKDNSGKRIGVNLSPGVYYLGLDKYGANFYTYGSYTVYPLFEPVTYPGDAEVNDNVSSAIILTLNEENTGNLGSRRDGVYDDLDYWKITIEEDGRLSILDTTESQLDYYINLYDADGTTLINSALRYKDNSGKRIGVNLSPGIYYMRLDKYGANFYTYGSYTVYPLFESVTYPGDAEVNDDVSSAITLTLNEENTGNLGSRRDGIYDDYDYWKITIEEDGRLSILDTTESQLDYHINLYDADGTTLIKSVLRYNDNSGGRIGVNLSPGVYYMLLDKYGANFYTYGSYTVYPLFEPVTYPGDPEPNDSIKFAQPMRLDTLFSGNLGSRRDGIYDNLDWWELNLSEGGLVTFSDSTESQLDYYLKLYESDGTTLIRSVLRYKDNSGSRISEKLSEGTYYLLLDRYGANYYTYGSYFINPGFLPEPKADFESSQDIRSFSFTNKSIDGETFYWDFDDGENSDQVNPSHTFTEPGEFLVTLIVSNIAGADTATQLITIYGVSGVSPQTGGNSGEVTLTILGGGFSEDASVTLSKEGSDDLVAGNVYYYERGAVRATFNLSGADLGEWDITVNNPGKAPIVEEKAFTIVQATEPEPWVNLSGRTKALFNRWQTYTLEYGNTGNVDADIVPVWITVSDPGNNELEFLDLDVLVPDYAVDNNQEARLDSITWYFDLDTLWGKIEPTRVYPLYIPKIPAGYTGNIKFRIKTSTQVKINVWNNAPLMENGVLKALCLEGNSLLGQCIEQAKNRAIRDLALTYIGLIPGGGCITSVTKEFFAIRDMRMESFSKRRSWGSFTYAMTGLFLGCVADFFPVTKLYQLAIAVTSTIQYLHDGIYQANKDCHEKFGMDSHKNKNVTGVYSFDPNEIIGPAGYGSGNYIEPVGTAVYTVYFENKDTATAPAQEIWVVDTLDLNKFNLDEFSFGTVSIGDTTINLLFGQKEFSMDIDFRPTKQLVGRVIGKLDTITGVVSVYFNSLDPVTMQQNEDPTLGILPPNVNSPEGEGSVSFSVGLYDLVNGEFFENKAMITFDFNEPIYTNTWLNTIDDQAPVSKIESYSYDADNNEVILNLSGSDNLAGVDYYMIYASINDSSYVPVLRASEKTVSFEITDGWDYKIYSVASDSLGHTEEAPNTEDLTFMITGISEQGKNLNEYNIYPNPATNVLYIETENPGNRSIEIITMDGRVIFKKQMNSVSESINVSGLNKGLYMIRISDNKFIEIQKVIIE